MAETITLLEKAIADIRRLGGIEERDLERLRKYHRAWQILRPRNGEP